MAYDLKYQSDFYNYFGKLVSVQLFKEGYGSHSVIPVRTYEVTLNVNNQDDNTSVIGTGVKVGIVNQGTFDSLEDLLTSTEKQFKCVITYDTKIVFQGFLICDVNEQQFLPFSKISLYFTDYLRRLDVDYLTCLEDISAKTSVYELIAETIRNTGLQNGTTEFLLLVNSTLFESTMDQGAASCFVPQTYVENNMFYTDPLSYDAINKISINDYDNTYDVLNKVLLSFGAYLYTAGDKFILERLDDVIRDGNWVAITDMGSAGEQSASTASLKTAYNKQANDFKYTEESQVIAYDSGWQRLDLDLQDKALGSLIFNNFTLDMPTCEGFAVTDFLLNQWYRAQASTAIDEVGYYWRAQISQYVKLTSDPTGTPQALDYEFEVTFNPSEATPTVLSVEYKISGDSDLSAVNSVTAEFILIVGDGTYAGYMLGAVPGPTTGSVVPTWVLPDTPNHLLSALNKQVFDTSTNTQQKVWTVSQSFDLTTIIFIDTPLGPIPFQSLWQQLGSPVKQKFILETHLLFYTFKGTGAPTAYGTTNYFGDFNVNISQPTVLNKLRYFINENFMKRESLNVDFFDLDNGNFANGLLTNLGATKTNSQWISTQFVTPAPLMDILARTKFGANVRTLHKLKGKILCDHYLKPFTILTDDNLKIGGVNLSLLLRGYTWDLNEGTYEIEEAIEYTDEAIIISESGNPPPAPGGLFVQQPSAGDHMVVTWTAVAGATGYILQRMPWSYNPGYNNNSFTTIYNGVSATFNDDMQLEPAYGLLASHYTVFYQVSAYNANGTSTYCAIVTGTWYK